jgi:hypothetical protein
MTTNATGSKCQVVRNVVSGGVMNSVHSWGRYHYRVMNDVVAGIVGLLIWMIMRAIIRADRTERKVYSRMEAEERARRGLPHKP